GAGDPRGGHGRFPSRPVLPCDPPGREDRRLCALRGLRWDAGALWTLWRRRERTRQRAGESAAPRDAPRHEEPRPARRMVFMDRGKERGGPTLFEVGVFDHPDVSGDEEAFGRGLSMWF